MITQALALLRLMRIQQWLKNGFVFTGLVFSHAWSDLPLVIQVVLAAIGFSLVSSSIYIINDFIDRAADRQHPQKRHRPLAAGTVAPFSALLLACLLAATGLALSVHVSSTVLAIVLAYAVLNLTYSLWLKHVVILDVFVIAAGFMLRILAGTLGVGIPPSQWLLLCGLMITLFLGFAKRRAEMMALPEGRGAHRRVLEHYSPVVLDKMIVVTAASTIITYGLYTMDSRTMQLHNTTALIYTVPFVMYAIFRYMFLLHERFRGGDPSTDVVTDPHIALSAIGWLVTVIWLIR